MNSYISQLSLPIGSEDDLGSSLYQEGQVSFLRIVLIIAGVILLRIITKQLMYIIVGRIVEGQKYTNKEEEDKRKNTLVSALNTITTVMYGVIGFMWILQELGINLSAAMTAVGAVGVVLGLAGQSAIKDFLRGMSIIYYDQMRVGDIVEILGRSGKVEAVSLQVVKLRNFDGEVHVIPNGDIGVVTNKTNMFSNVNMNLFIAYDNDIDKVERVINQVGDDMSNDGEWASRIIEPIHFLRINDFGNVSVEVKCFGKVLPGKQWQVAGEFRRRLKREFAVHGINIPYPQVVLHQADSIKDKKSSKSK